MRIPKTYVILYGNYTSIKKRIKGKSVCVQYRGQEEDAER